MYPPSSQRDGLMIGLELSKTDAHGVLSRNSRKGKGFHVMSKRLASFSIVQGLTRTPSPPTWQNGSQLEETGLPLFLRCKVGMSGILYLPDRSTINLSTSHFLGCYLRQVWTSSIMSICDEFCHFTVYIMELFRFLLSLASCLFQETPFSRMWQNNVNGDYIGASASGVSHTIHDGSLALSKYKSNGRVFYLRLQLPFVQQPRRCQIV